MDRLSLCALGTGGSSGRTIAQIEAILRRSNPELRMTLADTQPLNLRQPAKTFYPGQGEVVSLTPETIGLPTRYPSQSVNLVLNGGMAAWRRMIARARDVLTGCGAQALLMCNDRIYIETAFIEAARSLGIPSIFLQEGPMCAVGHGGANTLKMKAKLVLAPLARTAGLLPLMPDYGCAGHQRLLVASDDYKRRWVAEGVPADTVRVVGVARFDNIFERRAVMPPAPGKRRALFVVQPFAAHGKVDAVAARDVLRFVAAGLNKVNAAVPIDFVIRSHPRSSTDDVAALKEALDFPFTFSDAKSSIEDEIPNFDCIVGHYSTALLEAVLLGRPVVIAPVPVSAFTEPSEGAKQAWLETVGLPVARDAEGFAAALSGVLEGRAPQVDQARFGTESGVVDGQSTQRLAHEILEVVGRRRVAQEPLSAAAG